MLKIIAPSLTLWLLTISTAHANVDITFTESAPRDRFTIQNNSACTFEKVTIEIDLSSSVGKLFFDTSAMGDGVEVFQPFEMAQGKYRLISQNGGQTVIDGEDQLSLFVDSLKPGDNLGFTIDVDDRLVNSSNGQIRVTSAEIQGATAQLQVAGGQPFTGYFGSSSSASLEMPSC